MSESMVYWTAVQYLLFKGISGVMLLGYKYCTKICTINKALFYSTKRLLYKEMHEKAKTTGDFQEKTKYSKSQPKGNSDFHIRLFSFFCVRTYFQMRLVEFLYVHLETPFYIKLSCQKSPLNSRIALHSKQGNSKNEDAWFKYKVLYIVKLRFRPFFRNWKKSGCLDS